MNVLCFGELLVDFIGQETGQLHRVKSFKRYPGGSAANIAVGLARLGVSAGIVTCLGRDPFGDFLVDIMRTNGVDTTLVQRDRVRRTSLAFVSLDSDKTPSYVFYRHPRAGVNPGDVDSSAVSSAGIIYTSSMSIVNQPFRKTMNKVVRIARKSGTLVSFDVNLRLDLWSTPTEAKRKIAAVLRSVDILKITREELEFLYPEPKYEQTADSGFEVEEQQLMRLFKDNRNLRLAALTLGGAGCLCMASSGESVSVPAEIIDPDQIIDTTGAGDAFMAGLLASIVLAAGKEKNLIPGIAEIAEFCRFAGRAAALVIQKPGVIPALPTEEEINSLL